jgi:tetratricopeptide (TPR) repeat protein
MAILTDKEILTLVASAVAIVVSVASFFMTFRQRFLENRRTTRKALTDVVSELTKVNIAFTQLALDHPGSSDERIVEFRRNYNDQRRYLANHGAYLAQEIPELVTDIDCLIIGMAFASHGDYERAEQFHKLSVEKSPNNVIRVNTLRTLARFYFRRGNPALGRKTYQDALEIELPRNDSMRQFVADTYLLWGRIEQDSGFLTESQRLQVLARDNAELIGQKNMREDTLKQIEMAFGRTKATADKKSP